MLSTKLEDSKSDKLKRLIEKKAILRRSPSQEPFILASGDSTYVFFECKRVTQDPEGIALIAELIFDRVKNYGLDRIGGIQTGSIPICTAVAQLSHIKKQPIPAFWVREKQKEHGTKSWIEGGLKRGDRVVIVDDVTTKGNSVMKAVKVAQKLDCEIVESITMVDRESDAKELFKKEGIPFKALFKISDFNI